MSVKSTLLAGAFALLSTGAAFADGIMIKDAYARSSGMSAKAGAAFFEIHNHGDEADRLIAASSEISARTELHTHKDMGDGVMKMMEVEEGFEIPSHGAHALARGGDHVMFMGLKEGMAQGDTVKVTLTFEKAGDIVVEIPIDLERKPGDGEGHAMKHDDMKQDHGKDHDADHSHH